MKSSDNGNLILDEANEIIENFIKKTVSNNTKKDGKNSKISKCLMLFILTVTAIMISYYIIRII